MKSLSEILPKGAEGGREFARIIDLLLFHQSRRDGKRVTIFSDVAGDYKGLDSVKPGAFRRDGSIGYQYKFFPSPLTLSHRREIEASLKKAAAAKDLNLDKWILVTPDDLIESGRRKGGGDVTWFEGLTARLKLDFECEHWGHTKLLALFLETRHLCLYYYPELVPEGARVQSTLQRVRADYDTNFISLYRQIEFVGMSVYKPEATRGIPMENIYIPLSVTPVTLASQEADPPRTNPITLLSRGARHVILGDPGSGKSTLVKFLSLVGTSESLRRRYGGNSDPRLPILVVLRRYADELKGRGNLSLLDFIKEATQADFTLRGADEEFFEYYLESGQAILCFDGLDELPNPHYKQLVRDRIRSLLTTFPGNTAIVTSRIIGYDEPFRFDENEFAHYQLTRLALAEMESFVKDWYEVRIENIREREANIRDLTRILNDPDHSAIRELAENPLLLTIVALVHRIDAVLPDERVVLYQKCTETLLNTWQTWKYRGAEVKQRGRNERRNRRRMEGIAFWMHCQSGGTEQRQRAVASHADLLRTLATHITAVEKPTEDDVDAEDLAEDFLEFVRKRAGLLIEVGDDRYSFIHLTFQEYLAASGIITMCERDGIDAVWAVIKPRLADPRWHEVIRLLIAGLKSEESQEYVVNKLLEQSSPPEDLSVSVLLGGLLVDGIAAAEARAREIIEYLCKASASSTKDGAVRPILRLIDAWTSKDPQYQTTVSFAMQNAVKYSMTRTQNIAVRLLKAALDPATPLDGLDSDPKLSPIDVATLRAFLSINEGEHLVAPESFDTFRDSQAYDLLSTPFQNAVASACHAVTELAGPEFAMRCAFDQQLLMLSSDIGGPWRDGNRVHLRIALGSRRYLRHKLVELTAGTFSFKREHALRASAVSEAVEDLINTAIRGDGGLLQSAEFVSAMKRFTRPSPTPEGVTLRLRAVDVGRLLPDGDPAQQRFWTDPLVTAAITQRICAAFSLRPEAHWAEALRLCFIPTIPKRLSLFDTDRWMNALAAVKAGTASRYYEYMAAWLLMFSAWMQTFGYARVDQGGFFHELARAAESAELPELHIARCVRAVVCGEPESERKFAELLKIRDRAYLDLFARTLGYREWRRGMFERVVEPA